MRPSMSCGLPSKNGQCANEDRSPEAMARSFGIVLGMAESLAILVWLFAVPVVTKSSHNDCAITSTIRSS